MKLVMYFGNDFIAAIDIAKNQLSQPGYIGKMKRKLLEENKYDIDIRSEEVEFLLVNLQGKQGN
ncbi:hypothetical protein HRH25_18505 [Flavisolibacter sp. BT320]|nr:hypothetical protein [Flavisolibacter longurius]